MPAGIILNSRLSPESCGGRPRLQENGNRPYGVVLFRGCPSSDTYGIDCVNSGVLRGSGCRSSNHRRTHAGFRPARSYYPECPGALRVFCGADPNIEAARRRDALARWRTPWRRAEQPTGGRSCGRPSVHPLPLAGARRSLEPSATPGAPTPASTRSGRSRRAPAPGSPHVGKEKLGPILREQGYPTSNATVGRIIGAIIRRGTVSPVPALIRKVAAKAAPKKRPHAIRETPRALPSKSPATSSDRHPLDLSAARRLHRAFQRLRSLRQMDRRQAVQTSHCQKRRRVPRRGPRTNARSPQSHSRSTAATEFMAEFEQPAPTRTCPSTSYPPIAKAQRSCRALQWSLALRVLRLRRSPNAHRPESPKWSAPSKTSTTTTTPRSPCRKNPSRVPRYPPSQRNSPVSYVLSQDRGLTPA